MICRGYLSSPQVPNRSNIEEAEKSDSLTKNGANAHLFAFAVLEQCSSAGEGLNLVGNTSRGSIDIFSG